MSLIIYKSSAGSGKTYTLVREYVKLLVADPKEYRHILAITFTNKATEEMKSRIITALSRLANGTFEGLANELAVELAPKGLSHQKIRYNAKRALVNILHNYSEFSISTIDSFFQKILRNFAKELKLPLRYEVELDDKYVIEQVVAYLMLDIGHRKEFTRFLEEFTFRQMEENNGWYIEENIKTLGREVFKERIWDYLSRKQRADSLQSAQEHAFIKEENAAAEQLPTAIRTLVAEDDAEDSDEIPDNFEGTAGENVAENGMPTAADNLAAINTPPTDAVQQGETTSHDYMAAQYAELEQLIELLWKIKKDFEQRISEFSNEADQHIAGFGLQAGDFKRGTFNWFKDIAAGNFKFNDTRKKIAEGNIGEWVTKTAPKRAQVEACVNNGLNDIFLESIAYYEQNKGLYLSAKAVLKSIYSFGIMGDIKDKLRDYRTNNNTMMIADTNNILRAIISENDAPFIFEKVGTVFKHVLIDEFQDTSDFQWLNLLPLVKDALGNDNTALVVGDVKQSIYRWRGGNLSLLLNGIKENLGAFFDENTERELNRNFRSKEAIVQFNNAFFTTAVEVLAHNLQLPQNTLNELYLAYQSVAQEPKRAGGGYVEVRFVADTTDTEESSGDGADNDNPNDTAKGGDSRGGSSKNGGGNGNKSYDTISDNYDENSGGGGISSSENSGWKANARKQLLELLKDLNSQDVPASDIAILVRKNEEGSQLAKFLSEAGYKVISSEALLLNNSRKIRLLISALQYLADHRNKIARTELLVNYCLFYPPDTQNLNYHDLCSDHIYRPEQDHIALFDRLLPQNFTQHLFDLIARPLYETAETLVQIFDFHHQADAYIQRFLDLILEKQTAKNYDLHQFLDWWNGHKDSDSTSLAVPKGEDAITIMTIHKAKGLEFPVVLMPYADWDIAPKVGGLLWAETTQAPFDRLGMVPLKVNKDIEDTIFAESYRREKVLSLIDNLNLLYVALTRPTERLYLFAQRGKLSGEFRRVFQIIYSVLSGFSYADAFDLETHIFAFGDKNTPHSSENKADNSVLLEHFLSDDYKNKLTIRSEAARFFMLFDNAQTEAVRLGQKVHSVLEKTKHPNDLGKVLRQLNVKGIVEDNEIEILRQRVEQIFAMPDVKEWFNADLYDEILCERTLMRDASRRIPDRVMIKGNCAVIVDYKTGEKSASHARQLNRYAFILERMGYVVSGQYLLYIGENGTEVVRVEAGV